MLFISLMFLFASTTTSLACSCMASLDPIKQQVKASYKDAAAIFSGEIMEVTLKDEYSLTVKIKVAKVWKGKFSKEIIITTNKDSSMCGYRFATGEKYLIYAHGDKDDLSVGNCSRTSGLGGSPDIKYLNNLKKTKGKKA